MTTAIIMAGDSELALDLGYIFLSYSHGSMHIDCAWGLWMCAGL